MAELEAVLSTLPSSEPTTVAVVRTASWSMPIFRVVSDTTMTEGRSDGARASRCRAVSTGGADAGPSGGRLRGSGRIDA
jgi:hypothetical protein